MKLNLKSTTRLIGAGLILSLAGCADTANKEALLTAAGFKARTPETAKQKELFAAATPYQIHRITAKGRTFYAYKDEKQGVAFVGGPAEYQKFQLLATQQQIAQDQLMAAEMNQQMAWNWYGAWGPNFYW